MLKTLAPVLMVKALPLRKELPFPTHRRVRQVMLCTQIAPVLIVTKTLWIYMMKDIRSMDHPIMIVVVNWVMNLIVLNTVVLMDLLVVVGYQHMLPDDSMIKNHTHEIIFYG